MKQKTFDMPEMEVVLLEDIYCDVITNSGPGNAEFGAENGDEWNIGNIFPNP